LIGGYVDRVLRRVATRSDGWLTYFYRAESFGRAWAKIGAFAEAAGRDRSTLRNVAQLPICIDRSYEKADRRVRAFIDEYFDVAAWSESTPESALRGTPEQCAEQLAEHLEAGVQHVCFVPCDYAPDQVDLIHSELLPLVRATSAAGAR
jgi:alkanesulfonate monooxygenase